MPRRPLAQSELFDDTKTAPLPLLQPQLRAAVLQQMVQWLQLVAAAVNEEASDEQDQR